LNTQHPTRNFQYPTKLIPDAFRLYFIIGHSVFDIGYSSLKLIAMGSTPGYYLSSLRDEDGETREFMCGGCVKCV
jgi:hypothetical protein